jgi:DDE family transposase
MTQRHSSRRHGSRKPDGDDSRYPVGQKLSGNVFRREAKARPDQSCAKQIVALANERCDQENVIEQLKNGVNAMRMPVDDLISNWVYMVMSALAWNLKSWYGLLMPNRQRGLELVRMEFRRFLHVIVLLPAQIVRSGRRIIYRIMGYNSWLKDFFATWEKLRRMAPG